MGGAVAALYAIERVPARGYALAGLVLSSPALAPGRDVPRWMLAMSRIISRIWPTFPAIRIDAALLSRDPAIVAANRADPLVHHGAVPARTGAEILGRSPLPGDPAQAMIRVDRELVHNDALITPEFSLRALHTPGHVGNHLCYLLAEEKLLFSGDHLINGSTVVIIPPSGSMADYLRSLDLLAHEDIAQIAPGHGDVIENAQALIQFTIHHRLAREAKVLGRLTRTPQTRDALTPHVYDDVAPALHPVARYSLHAHLIKLRDEGKVKELAEGWTT